MLFKQMKYFMTVIDCNSFTEAAEQCFISQSAISQQIKSLEKELGVELLVRENRQFTLTPAGEYFYRHGKVVLDEIEDFKEETIALRQLPFYKNYRKLSYMLITLCLIVLLVFA
mgnify:CR=1 FL=1